MGVGIATLAAITDIHMEQLKTAACPQLIPALASPHHQHHSSAIDVTHTQAKCFGDPQRLPSFSIQSPYNVWASRRCGKLILFARCVVFP